MTGEGRFPFAEAILGGIDASESRTDIPLQLALEALIRTFGYENVLRVTKNLKPKKKK